MVLLSVRRRAAAGLVPLLAISLASLPVATAHAGQAGSADRASKHKLAALRNGMWRPDGTVEVVAVHGQRIYVAGDFTHMVRSNSGTTATRFRIAAVNRANGALITSFHPHVNGTVRALAVFNHQLFLGGDFTKVNGKSRAHLAAVGLSNGKLAKAWHPRFDGTVSALLHLRHRLYVGGDFTHLGRAKARRLAAFDRDRRAVHGWPTQGAYGPVFALAASRDHHSVLVGGHFKRLNTQARVNLGAINLRGRVTGWTPPAVCVRDCPVRDIAVTHKLVYAGVDGPGGRVRAYRSVSGKLAWGVKTNGDVTAVAMSKGQLLIGGHFTTVVGQDRSMFAVLDAATGDLTTRSLAASGSTFPGVLDIRVFKGVALLGGAFDSIAAQDHLAAVAP